MAPPLGLAQKIERMDKGGKNFGTLYGRSARVRGVPSASGRPERMKGSLTRVEHLLLRPQLALPLRLTSLTPILRCIRWQVTRHSDLLM